MAALPPSFFRMKWSSVLLLLATAGLATAVSPMRFRRGQKVQLGGCVDKSREECCTPQEEGKPACYWVRHFNKAANTMASKCGGGAAISYLSNHEREHEETICSSNDNTKPTESCQAAMAAAQATSLADKCQACLAKKGCKFVKRPTDAEYFCSDSPWLLTGYEATTEKEKCSPWRQGHMGDVEKFFNIIAAGTKNVMATPGGMQGGKWVSTSPFKYKKGTNDPVPHGGNLLEHMKWSAVQVHRWCTGSEHEFTPWGKKEPQRSSPWADVPDCDLAVAAAFVHDVGKGGDCAFECVDGDCFESGYSSMKYENTGAEWKHPQFGADQLAGKKDFFTSCPTKDKFAEMDKIEDAEDKYKALQDWLKVHHPDGGKTALKQAGEAAFSKTEYKLMQFTTAMHWELGKTNFDSGAPDFKPTPALTPKAYVEADCEKAEAEGVPCEKNNLKTLMTVSAADIAAGDVPDAMLNTFDPVTGKKNGMTIRPPCDEEDLKNKMVAAVCKAGCNLGEKKCHVDKTYTSKNPFVAFGFHRKGGLIRESILKAFDEYKKTKAREEAEAKARAATAEAQRAAADRIG